MGGFNDYIEYHLLSPSNITPHLKNMFTPTLSGVAFLLFPVPDHDLLYSKPNAFPS